jgi:addiction module RelB/DinJ family antitoxin
MNNTVISVKVDKKIKEQAMEVAKSTGIPLSSLINAYLRQLVATRRIEIYAPEPMTPKLERAIAAVEADIKQGKNLSPKFTNAKDAIAWLNK